MFDAALGLVRNVSTDGGTFEDGSIRAAILEQVLTKNNIITSTAHTMSETADEIVLLTPTFAGPTKVAMLTHLPDEYPIVLMNRVGEPTIRSLDVSPMI